MIIETVTQHETFSTKYKVKLDQINWEDLLIDLDASGQLVFTMDEVIEIVRRNIVRTEAAISVSDESFMLLTSSTYGKAYVVEQLTKELVYELLKKMMDHND